MEKENPLSSPTQVGVDPIVQRKNGRIKMLAILAVCLAPVIASYFTYYVIKPTARTNYGELLDPAKYPTPNLDAKTLEGTALALDDYKGKWLLIQVDVGSCNQLCKVKLLDMRQVRLTLGKEMDRFERVWLITDDQVLDEKTVQISDGVHLLRVKSSAVNAWLATNGSNPSNFFYVVDPRGNLMMRFPKSVNLYKMKADLTKLLTASSIG